MDNQPKISIVEAFLLIVIAVIADVLSVIPVVGWVVWIGMAGVMLYLKFGKGILPMAGLIAFIVEFIPIINILPIYTAGMIATIVVDRNPKIRAAVEKVAIKKPVSGFAKIQP